MIGKRGRKGRQWWYLAKEAEETHNIYIAEHAEFDGGNSQGVQTLPSHKRSQVDNLNAKSEMAHAEAAETSLDI